MSEKYLGLIPVYDCKTGEKGVLDMSGVRPSGAPLTKAACRDQRLVDIFVDMGAPYRQIWMTKPVLAVLEEDYNNRKAKPRPTEPIFVRIEFAGGPILQYASRSIVCDIASALQECSDWKPSDALQAYLNEHRKVEHITFSAVPQYCDGQTFKDFMGETLKPSMPKPREGQYFKDFIDEMWKNEALDLPMANSDLKTYSDEDVRARVLGQRGPGTKIQSAGRWIAHDYDTEDNDSKPLCFSDAPFKVIRDYLYACSFLSPYAPGFIDYANDLLAYRLSYAISQEKDLGARQAISNLAHDLNDYATQHVDEAYGLQASTKVELFSGAILPALTVRSDFGIITVQYEPELTTLDWESRYAALRTRHG